MPDPSCLSAYVTALEKQNRLLRQGLGLLVGLILLGSVLGAQVIADSLVVHETFIVKDRNGIDRFEMVVNQLDGATSGFHIVDANGKTRIDMGVDARGNAVIAFLDARGRVIRTLP